MRMEIKNEKYNRFMKRKELEIYLEHPEQATPSSASVQDLVAKQVSAEAEKIEVRQIMTSSGAAESNGVVFIWDEKIVKKSAEAAKETASE